MLQTYINNINHNRYLKINYKNQYNYSQLYQIIINIRFKKNLNNKFAILYIIKKWFFNNITKTFKKNIRYKIYFTKKFNV